MPTIQRLAIHQRGGTSHKFLARDLESCPQLGTTLRGPPVRADKPRHPRQSVPHRVGMNLELPSNGVDLAVAGQPRTHGRFQIVPSLTSQRIDPSLPQERSQRVVLVKRNEQAEFGQRHRSRAAEPPACAGGTSRVSERDAELIERDWPRHAANQPIRNPWSLTNDAHKLGVSLQPGHLAPRCIRLSQPQRHRRFDRDP